MGAQVVKEVACKTNDVAGDGTTTATLLATDQLSERASRTWPQAQTLWITQEGYTGSNRGCSRRTSERSQLL